jgi:uncharacterized membrane protein YkoI
MKQKLLILAAIFALTISGSTTAQTKKKIGMKKAREIAYAKAAGKIESAELEKENGKLVYSFDIRNDKGTITEVQVEAYTGEIVSVEEETTEKEAAEKKAEKKKKH